MKKTLGKRGLTSFVSLLEAGVISRPRGDSGDAAAGGDRLWGWLPSNQCTVS